jgi:hypothetical protein
VRRQAPQQITDRAHREAQPMYAEQPGLDHADGGTHDQAQMRHQAGNPHADTPLAQHLPSQVQRGFPPGMTDRTPAFEDRMFNDLNRWWRGQAPHLPTTHDMRNEFAELFQPVFRGGC